MRRGTAESNPARAAARARLSPWGTDRVESFSDSVFAFAATLLVLNLRDPGGDLARGLLREWPSYAAYAVSFLTIGIIWINHGTLFGRLGRLDRPLVVLNLLLLMIVAVIPFPTAMLARYARDGASSHAAGILYGTTMTVMGIMFTAIWWRVTSREHLLADGTTAHHARAALRRSLKGPIVYAAATALSALSAPAALAGYAAVAIYFALPGRTLTPIQNDEVDNQHTGTQQPSRK